MRIHNEGPVGQRGRAWRVFRPEENSPRCAHDPGLSSHCIEVQRISLDHLEAYPPRHLPNHFLDEKRPRPGWPGPHGNMPRKDYCLDDPILSTRDDNSMTRRKSPAESGARSQTGKSPPTQLLRARPPWSAEPCQLWGRWWRGSVADSHLAQTIRNACAPGNARITCVLGPRDRDRQHVALDGPELDHVGAVVLRAVDHDCGSYRSFQKAVQKMKGGAR
jgi:hypothetical protein